MSSGSGSAASRNRPRSPSHEARSEKLENLRLPPLCGRRRRGAFQAPSPFLRTSHPEKSEKSPEISGSPCPLCNTGETGECRRFSKNLRMSDGRTARPSPPAEECAREASTSRVQLSGNLPSACTPSTPSHCRKRCRDRTKSIGLEANPIKRRARVRDSDRDRSP